jgi:hypothetical protein
VRTYPCKIVGLRYERREEYILDHVAAGDTIILKHEPRNRYDPNAVAAYHRRRKIGYIPSDKPWVCKSIIEGDEHEVEVTDLYFNDDGELTSVDIAIIITKNGSGPSPVVARPTLLRQVITALRLRR